MKFARSDAHGDDGPVILRPGTDRRYASILVCTSLCLVACGGGEPATREPAPERSSEPPEDTTTEVEDAGSPGEAVPDRTPGLALGGAFSCVLREDGAISCWGSNRNGQLADPDLETGEAAFRGEAARVPGIPDPRQLEAGALHACALAGDGVAWCWGHGGWGQLGDGEQLDRAVPGKVELDGPIVELALGEGHSCARRADRTVHCWGRNTHGELGMPPGSPQPTPKQVPGIEDAVEIAAGSAHTCARRADGTVHCWGENVEGQLGSGDRSAPEGFRPTPAPVQGALAATGLWVRYGQGCMQNAAGDVRCFGRNDSGQLGSGPRRQSSAELIATPVAALSGVADVAFGSRHMCARHPNGTVTCAGGNIHGQLAQRGRTEGFAQVSGVEAVDIAAGAHHTCAIRADGAVFCWGANRWGQLGDGTHESRFMPAPVLGTLPPASAPATPTAAAGNATPASTAGSD